MIGTETVTHVTQDGATLSARSTRSGSDTKVQFQFVTDAVFVSAGIPAVARRLSPSTPIDIGSGTSAVTSASTSPV